MKMITLANILPCQVQKNMRFASSKSLSQGEICRLFVESSLVMVFLTDLGVTGKLNIFRLDQHFQTKQVKRYVIHQD